MAARGRGPFGAGKDLAPAHQAATVADEFGFLGFGRKKRRLRVVTEHFGQDWRGTEADAKNLVAIVADLIEARAQRSQLAQGLGSLAGIGLSEDWNPFTDGDIQSVAEQCERLLHLAGLLPRSGEPAGRGLHPSAARGP